MTYDSRKLLKISVNVSFNSCRYILLIYMNDFQPQSDLLGLLQILILVFGEEPPLVCKPQQLDQSYTPRLYPSSSSSTSSIPYLPYPTTFRYPISTSQFANSGPGQYHVSAPQCDTSEAKTPTSMNGKFECTKRSVFNYVHIQL